MAFDDPKNPGDLITSDNYNTLIQDLKGHAQRHKDGGVDELDAAELAGALGNSGSLLVSDGSTSDWSDLIYDESAGRLLLNRSSPLAGSFESLTIGSDSGDNFNTVGIESGGGGSGYLAFDSTGQKVFEFFYSETPDDAFFRLQDTGVNFAIQDNSANDLFRVNFDGSAIDAASTPIQSVSDPSNPQDAATKSFVEASAAEQISFNRGFTAYGETNGSFVEIWEYDLDSGDSFELEYLHYSIKNASGGLTDFEIEVFDVTNNTSVASVSSSAKKSAEPIATVPSGVTFQVRFRNDTGVQQAVAINMEGERQ